MTAVVIGTSTIPNNPPTASSSSSGAAPTTTSTTPTTTSTAPTTTVTAPTTTSTTPVTAGDSFSLAADEAGSTAKTRKTRSTSGTEEPRTRKTGTDALPGMSAEDLPPQKVPMGGFGGKPLPKVNINLTLNPGQVGTTEKRDAVDKEGWTVRGFFDVKYQPAVGGVDIEVESHHVRPKDPTTYEGDDLLLYLQARVLDEGRERVITLATMMDGVINPDKGPVGRKRFHVSYQAINRWLHTKNKKLQFHPGDPLAVFGVWKKEGHQWGGFCRGGYFESPQPVGRKTAVDVRSKGITDAAPVAKSTEYIDKPIDITLKIPETLVETYDKVLVPNAKLVSRREHEQKFCTRSLDELRDTVKKVLDVCGAAPLKQEEWLLEMMGRDEALSSMAGHDVSGWHIKTTDRYYSHDREGKIVNGPDGLPLVAPMVDAYQDSSKGTGYYPSSSNNFPIARANMAARFRDGEIKAGESLASMGKLNMKTTRVVDPFTLTQTGLEISLDTKYGVSNDPEALKQLAELLNKTGAPYSPLPELKKSSYSLTGEAVTEQAVVNVANRYKFTLEHENGMELEVSMDFVHAGIVCKTVEPEPTKGMDETAKYDFYENLFRREDGSAVATSGQEIKRSAHEKNQVVYSDGTNLVMAQFWMDETGAKHVTEHPCVRFPQVEIEMDHVQARTTGPLESAYSRPTTTTIISNDEEQDAFLASVSDKVTMNGPPMIHAFEDLKNPRLYEDPNYKQMQEAVVKFREFVFPNGVLPARQKAAQALENAGLISKDTLKLSATMPYRQNSNVSMYASSYSTAPSISVRGNGTVLLPVTAEIDFNGFPMRIPLDGTETAKDVAEKVSALLNKTYFYKTEIEEKDGYAGKEYYVKLLPKD